MLDISYRKILVVALPLMLSGFIQSIISITDAAFLGHYSDLAFEASGSAGLWYITLHMVFLGLSDGSQIAMATAVGENEPKRFARYFQSNFLWLFFAAIIMTCFVWAILPQLVGEVVTRKPLAEAETRFLQIRSLAFWASVITLSIQSAYMALGKTTLVMAAAIITALSNVLLDYAWIFGHFGFPEWGLEGAAAANTLAEYIGMTFLLLSLLFGKTRKDFPIFKQLNEYRTSIFHVVKLGYPLVFQGLVALSIWTIFFNWVEQMGGNNLNVSLNIRHIYFLAFVPIWGFAGATKTYVAQYVGAKEFDKINIIQRRIQVLTIGFLVLVFHGAVFYPDVLIRLINENETNISQSADILRMVSGSIVIYAFVMVYFQTISGSGNTKMTFVVECLATFSYLLAAYLFIKVWNWPIYWVWLVEYVYFIMMGACSLIYLKSFNWKKL